MISKVLTHQFDLILLTVYRPAASMGCGTKLVESPFKGKVGSLTSALVLD